MRIRLISILLKLRPLNGSDRRSECCWTRNILLWRNSAEKIQVSRSRRRFPQAEVIWHEQTNQGSPRSGAAGTAVPFGSEERDWSGHRATDPMPGVQISGTHPIYAVVNLSALHRHSLAPNVYIPSAQADAVRSKLAPKQTVQGLLEALEDMTEKQAACFPNNGTVLLNDKTVGALRQYLHSAVEEDAEHG